MPPSVRETELKHLRHAARLALRGRGGAEPNPLVGCVIIGAEGELVGWGYHRTCGEAHAEINALRMAGELARGATAYITLEPCNHQGRTGPCSEALIKAGVSRVVIGRRDPNSQAAGGIECLRAAGIAVDFLDDDVQVTSVSAPFVHRISTGRPWVIAKWAQTLDGRIATRTGESQWISSDASRRLVHRRRGQVDAILTGIGTVLADDPLLTARDVRIRRRARRVVIDPKLQTPLPATLVQSAGEIPATITCDVSMLETNREQARRLTDAGVELIGFPMIEGELPLEDVLRELVKRHDIANVLVEAGSGLLGRLFRLKLVNEAWVFIAPKLIGDEQAMSCVRDLNISTLTDAVEMTLHLTRRRGDDLILHYGVEGAGDGSTGVRP